MPTQRLTELPDTVLRLIEKASGPIVDVQAVNAGRNSAIAARVRITDRMLFVKGLPFEHPRVWTQEREADVGPHIKGTAPVLHWHVEEDGWSLLGFEYVEGGHADYTPGSPDLPAVMATMARLAELSAPDIELKNMAHRLRTYVVEPAEPSWFTGASLLHTEWNPHNVVMTDRGALFVDWGWASTGAAWIDPALWLLWLIAHGHTPARPRAKPPRTQRGSLPHPPTWTRSPVRSTACGTRSRTRARMTGRNRCSAQHGPGLSIGPPGPDRHVLPRMARADGGPTNRSRMPLRAVTLARCCSS